MRWPFFRRRERSIERLQDTLSDVKTAAHFCSTPWSVVREILELAGVGPADVLYDLGSGDGRIPILAAQEFGCRAVGIELDRDLFEYSERRVLELNLQSRVSFLLGNFFEADLSSATVVILYLLSAVNGHLRAHLASQLRAGSRVVAIDFDVPGWRPDRTLSIVSDGNVEYTLYLYRRSSAGTLWRDAPVNNPPLSGSSASSSDAKDSSARDLKGNEDD